MIYERPDVNATQPAARRVLYEVGNRGASLGTRGTIRTCDLWPRRLEPPRTGGEGCDKRPCSGVGSRDAHHARLRTVCAIWSYNGATIGGAAGPVGYRLQRSELAARTPGDDRCRDVSMADQVRARTLNGSPHRPLPALHAILRLCAYSRCRAARHPGLFAVPTQEAL